MVNLKGQGVIIVGARRVGQVVALRLAREGANFAIAYRRSKTEAEALLNDLAPFGGKNGLVQGDVSIEADAARMVDQAGELLGNVHGIVDLASDFERVPFAKLDGPAWDRGMAEAKGAYLLAIHATRRMMLNPGPLRGHVVLFSDSSSLQTPYSGYLPYLTAKATIDFLTRVLALEFAPHGILVNAIAPGPTLKPPDMSPDVWEEVLDGTPLKHESTPEDIAEMVATLLKTESITGETIRVDAGGHLAGHGPA